MIEFTLLGEIALRGDAPEALERVLRQPKRLALLAYLASPTPGTWHRRDTILGLFWQEMDTAHARTSLRNALYVLRQSLGDGVIHNRGDEELSVDPGRLTTDVAAVRAALDRGDAAEALRWYRGELLPGLYPPDSDGFQRWLDAERSRLGLDVTRAAIARSVQLEAEGRIDTARDLVRRVLELAPYDETVVRRLMSLHDHLGDPAGALAVMADYRTMLAREFEAVPSAETMALAAGLRGSATRALPPPASPRRAPALAATPQSRPAITLPPARFRRWVGWLIPVATLAGAALVLRATRGHDAMLEVGRSYPITAEEELQVEPAISPNGRLVAYAAGTPQRMRILVRRVEGGTPWALSPDSSTMQLLPRWSPDGDAVAYLAGPDAYVSAAVGGAPRLVAAGGEGEGAGIHAASWSPRGDSLAVVRNDSLLVVPREGGGFRFVGQGRELHSCAWSPDGRWIACVSGNWIAFTPGTLFGNKAPSAIVRFAAAGSPPLVVTDEEYEHASPGWSADSRALWFVSDRDGQRGQVYAVSINASGQPGAVVRQALLAESIDLAGARIAYSVPSRRANIYAIPIDGHEPMGLAQAVRVTSGNQVIEVLRASRDGAWLVYDSDVGGNSDIYRLPTVGGAPERLTDDPRQEFAGDLAPDGASVAYHRWENGARRLMFRDLRTGAVSPVLDRPGDQGVPNWSPDGQALAVWAHDGEPGSVFLVARDSRGGWHGPVATLPEAQLPVWSPDGRSLTVLHPNGSITAVTPDLQSRQILYAPQPGSDDPLATYVARDRRHAQIWFLGHRPSGAGGIWQLAADGGRPRLVLDFDDPLGRINGPTLASDGRRLYFTLEERLSNIRWAELTAP